MAENSSFSSIFDQNNNQDLVNDLDKCKKKYIEIGKEHSFLLSVLETMDVLVIVLDRNGQIVRFNRACQRLFGYSSMEVESMLRTGLLPLPEDIKALKSLFKDFSDKRIGARYENEWMDSKGNLRTITWTISALTKGSNQVENIFATGIDITNRIEAEKSLERERALLHGLINSIPDLIFYKDLNGVYTGCNTAFVNLRKQNISNIVGKTDYEIYGADKGGRYFDIDRSAITNRASICYEDWALDSNNQLSLIETRKSPYYDLDGTVLGIIGIGRDITKHRKSEDALRQAKSEIEQLIASLSSFLIVVTEDLRISKINPAAQNLFGLVPEKDHGRRLETVNIQWSWSYINEKINQCREKLYTIFLDPVTLKCKDGRERYVGININPLFDDKQKLSGFILLGGDITERKLMESRLAQAKRLESIGHLAAGIAHEINTPIQYVGDNISFLHDSYESVIKLLLHFDSFFNQFKKGQISKNDVMELEAAVQNIELPYIKKEIPLALQQSKNGINSVAEIIRGLREFSHPGVKEKSLLDINETLENALAITKNEWKYVANSIKKFDKELPKIYCAHNEINQVFINLIMNAAQAISTKGGLDGEKGIITIDTRHDPSWVEVRISDTGVGIKKEHESRIFEPFFTTKEVGKGTGQGLAIAYDIITHKHNGTITFESKPGQGTTFLIRLPSNEGKKTEGKKMTDKGE